jgi:hypothetical protein
MTKAPQLYRDDDVVVSFDAAAFVKAVTKISADSAPLTLKLVAHSRLSS